MATVQSLVPATTIASANTKLLSLCYDIFGARDFSKVENKIADASKIRFGLKALTNLTAEDEAYQQIIVGLNKLCKVY